LGVVEERSKAHGRTPDNLPETIPFACVPAAGRVSGCCSRYDNCAAHAFAAVTAVDATEVGVDARRCELLLEGRTSLQLRAVESPVVRRDGMGLSTRVFPDHGCSNRNGYL